jgi:hypothetical protein
MMKWPVKIGQRAISCLVKSMPIQKQLSVFSANRPGVLAHICGILAEADVNIIAVSVHDTVDTAVVRLVLVDAMKGVLLLEQEEFFITEQEVVVLPVDNHPGVMAKVAQALGRADINIEYAYCTATNDQDMGCIVLKTAEAERALKALHEFDASL